uniref:cGMP-dependent protein kinase interacting domain-containing protein n=1 Tax=Scleropages formosus TaxID=113540 RepID=A0A8C9VGU8_SCLFO
MQTSRHSSRSDVPVNDSIVSRGSEMKDFKRMFEEVSLENSRLQSQLQETQRTVSQTRADLDKATQRQERFSDCSALLELEKKERRLLERRVAELEDELKVRLHGVTIGGCGKGRVPTPSANFTYKLIARRVIAGQSASPDGCGVKSLRLQCCDHELDSALVPSVNTQLYKQVPEVAGGKMVRRTSSKERNEEYKQ